jgi:hypothetical protein
LSQTAENLPVIDLKLGEIVDMAQLNDHNSWNYSRIGLQIVVLIAICFVIGACLYTFSKLYSQGSKHGRLEIKVGDKSVNMDLDKDSEVGFTKVLTEVMKNRDSEVQAQALLELNHFYKVENSPDADAKVVDAIKALKRDHKISKGILELAKTRNPPFNITDYWDKPIKLVYSEEIVKAKKLDKGIGAVCANSSFYKENISVGDGLKDTHTIKNPTTIRAVEISDAPKCSDSSNKDHDAEIYVSLADFNAIFSSTDKKLKKPDESKSLDAYASILPF